MADHKRNLYDALSTKFDIGTYEDFESKIDNEEHRKRLYDAVSQTYDIGTYDEYNAKLGYQSDVTADAEDRPSWGETFIKGLGAAGVGTAKIALDLGRMAFNASVLGGAARMLSGKKIDEDLRDESKPLTRASMKLGEIQEKLSREADPTGGEKGFVDLLSEGKVGMALQKALGSGLESLPMMVAAASGPGALIYGAGMAASSYADETRDNPDIPAWKRGVNALGSAALEMAVERLGGPLKNLFGKAGGEISEDVAKEILKNVAKDGTENIAKRIIKKIGKEGLEEGGEEVLTSFGNDALGQALDWIDGDNDYGITAQWEQMKEENPDADLGDFARDKAKEYLDSFLGGALSGMQISSVPTATGEFAEASARSTVQARYEHGTKLDYQNMYDTDASVSEANAAVAAAFTNENGEQAISNEFIESLSADDAYALSRSEDISPNQRVALMGLAEMKATQEGLNKKLDDRVEGEINAQTAIIEGLTKDSKFVTTGTYNNRRVYVKGGFEFDGRLVLSSEVDPDVTGPVIVIDAITGESTTAINNEISDPISQDADEFLGQVEQIIRQSDSNMRETWRNTMSPVAKYKAVKPYAGKKILVDVGNGVTEVLVQKVSPNGDVLIKGKKGDLGGQSFLTLKADTFYDSIYRGDDGNPVVTDAGPEEVEQTEEPPVDETPEAEVNGDEDYREGTYTILINGVPVSVDVTGQDNTADRITYEYTDENGVRRSGGSTIGEFKSAIQQAATYAPPQIVPEQEIEPQPNPNVVGEIPVREAGTAEPEPTALANQPTGNTPLAPEDINWDELFEQDPEAYLAELQNQYGDETLDILNEEIAAAQEELDSLNKKRGKTQNERLENRKKKGVLQKRIETLNGMVARLTAPAVPEAPIESAPVAETPETPTESVGETPAPADEVPVEPVDEPTPAPEAETPEAPTEPTEPVSETPEAPAVTAETEPTPQETEAPTDSEPQPEPAPAPAPSKPVSKGGAVARLIGEARKQIAKLAAKAKIKDFILEDNTRPIMGGILRKGGYEYASDSHILAKIKSKYPAEQEGKVYSANTGQELTGRFPNADMVISSAEIVNKEIDANVDDILATAQAAEELKKGLDKNKKIYVRIGSSIFDSSYLVKAARMAKQQGLTRISQHPTEQRAMLFGGENGTVLIMPMNGRAIPDRDIIDAKTGNVTFGEFTPLSVKTPTSLKGIETARTTLEAILPNISDGAIERLKDYGDIKLIDGKVVFSFKIADIVNAKNKAKDPNTFAALEAIEKNGLEIPLSTSEIARIFPETVAQPAPTTEAGETPVAPNLVKNPIDEARKKERQLSLNLAKVGLSPEAKADLAFKAGKDVADMFATRDEYDAYAENAADFGSYNADFERGVEESFANRQQNVSNPPVNSVPLESEPNGENNGENGQADTGASSAGQSVSGSVRQTSDGGGQEVYQGTSEAVPQQGENKGKSNAEQVKKYPARQGNATQKLLIDTFGFNSVTIPNSRKDTLNAIYDFMMEMSKILGISPKSIGQGGWLDVESLRSNASASAEHSLISSRADQTVKKATLKYKYDRLAGLAHEWWHALDHALSYFETGKGKIVASEINKNKFTGRQETWEAVEAVHEAIVNSGHEDRIFSLNFTQKYKDYLIEPTEMIARAFDEYIKSKFADAGIVIKNAIDTDFVAQPTAEEMAVIAPAFDNLFKVLQEKEGKRPGTSVLYQIGEQMDNESEYTPIVNEALDIAFEQNASVNVHRLSDKEEEQAYKAAGVDPDTHFSIDTDKPIFISNAALAVIGIKQEKATPEQWLKMIEKAGGLKAGEDKWMGLSDWLKASDARTLTKQEVLDFINENTIRIEEVNYGEIDYFAEDQKLIDAINDEFLAFRREAQEAGEFVSDAGDIAYQKMVDKYGDDFYFAFGVDFGYLYVSNRGAASEITGVDLSDEKEINETRLGYTTDGLDNKKEIAIIVPTIEKWNEHDEIHFGDAGDGRAVAWVRFGDAKKLESTTEVVVVEEFEEPYKDVYGYDVYKPKGKKSSKDFIINKRLRDGRTGFVVYIKEKAIPQLHSTLEEARVAMNQYYSENPQKKFINRRVLVIDEIQSKRHQEGREKGYQTQESVEARKKAVERLKSTNNALYDYIDYLASKYPNTEHSIESVRGNRGRFTEEENTKLTLLIMESNSAQLEAEKTRSTAIPDAPFDKNWHELAMKRMLRYAAENGYDVVAWTKGEQQAERYNIGNLVREIISHETESGRIVDIRSKNNEDSRFVVDAEGKIIDSRGPIEANDKMLSDVVGKEVAKDIMEGVGSDITLWDGKQDIPAKKIDGDGLRIGGEGMKGFYDKMLPAFMNKYGKKWGVKVDDIKLFGLDNQESITMHSVPVNDAMKESVMEGQPMFFKTPNGIVYGWAKGNDIYLTKDGLNPNTKIHEYTHLWANAMMQRNPKGWESVKNLLKGTPVWNQVMNDTNYSDIHGNEDAVASEALSRISGADNAAKMEQMAKQLEAEAKGTARKLEARGLIQNMRDALNKFWNWVGTNLFGIEKFESIEQVTDRVLWDLLNNTDLGELSGGLVEAQMSKRSVEKNYGGLWIADKQEYAKFASAVNQYVFEENGQGIAYTDNHFYAYYWNNNGEPIPYIDVYLNANESQDVVNQINEEYGIGGNQGIGVYIDRAIERAKNIKDRRNDSTRTDKGTSSSRGDDIVGSYISRKGKYADKPSLYVTSVRPDGRTSRLNDITTAKNGNTEDAYTDNDGGGIQPETEGVSGEVSVSGPLSEERRLYNPEGREVSQDAYTRFNPIHEREGESDNRRNLRETRFFEAFEKLTTDEKVLLYNFLNEYLPKSSGVLKSKTNDFIEPIRAKGNTAFADFVEDFINDELKYREGVSASTAAKHGLLVGISYDASRLEQIFDAYNNDKYNEALFDRAIKLAKRFGVSIKFATRNEDGSFFAAYGNYNPSDNTITLDANLLTEDNRAELCQTIVHELIHSIVTRSTSIMSGRAVDKNNQFIDPQSLPKDVVDGINTLKDVYEAIKDDGDFQDTYGKTDFEEMLSEITDSKFRGLLKAKKLWKKFLHGICQILGIADESSSETDALTEIESALDKILSAAERGELDSAYASYLGQLAKGYTLEDLQNLASGPVKTMLAQNIMFRTGIDPTEIATQTAAQTYDRVVNEGWQEFQRQFQDAYQPVRIGIDAIQQETGNIPIEDYENYLLIQNQSSSRSRVEIDNFQRKYYSPIVEQVNAIIDKIMEYRGWDVKNKTNRSKVYKEVINYLIAKHGLERNMYYQNSKGEMRDYSGLTSLFGFSPEQYEEAEQTAQDYVDNFESEVDTTALWDKINAATDKTLRHSYESGLLSRQQYNDIKAMFDFYIPLRGFDETTAEDVYAYARFEGNRFNPAVATAKGRTSLSDDPLAFIMNMAESEIAQGNKNRAKQALYNFIINRPVTGADGNQKQNSLMQVEDVWYVKTVDDAGNDVYKIVAPDHSTGETWEDFENRMMADPNAVKSKKGQVNIGMRFQKSTNKGAHYIYLKVNGVEKAIYINGDPKIADAVNGTYASKPSEVMQTVRDVQRLVSSTFTNYSLEFTARNYFRDMVYSHINVAVKEPDPAYRKKFRRNWRHNNLASMVKMLNAYRAGEYDGRPLNEDEAAFVEFMNNGGQTGYTLINSVETRKKDLERAIKNMQKGIVNGGVKDSTIFKYTLGGIELLNEASELVTRFAAFKTSRDMGRSINKSISDAKEITVNFNTKGAQDGKGWMGMLASYLGAVKYFFNASVQGVQNLYNAFQTNKLKFGKVVCGVIGTGMMMPVLQGALSELLGGDEDEYWNIPEYDRQNNLCFVIGKGKYVKVPLPIGFREMYAIGDMIMGGFMNKKFTRNPLTVGMDVASKMATIILPINPLEGSANGLSLIESAQDMFLPDVSQGLIQNRTNTDFKGAPLQKEYTYNEDNPQWTKAFASNPSWLKGLSKWCYEHIVFDGVGWDWSPEKLDNTLSNALGGIYSLVKKTGRTVSMIWNEDNRNLSNIPLIGVTVGSNIDEDERFVNSAYWEMEEYYSKRLYKIKATAENFGYTLNEVFARAPEGERAGEHQPAMNKIYNRDNFDFMQEWYWGHKGEGENDENGDPILGLDQIRNKIKNLETKIKKNENREPTLEQAEELVRLNNLYDSTRRDFVNDMLELD